MRMRIRMFTTMSLLVQKAHGGDKKNVVLGVVFQFSWRRLGQRMLVVVNCGWMRNRRFGRYFS